MGAGPESTQMAVHEQVPAEERAADPAGAERVQAKGNKFVLGLIDLNKSICVITSNNLININFDIHTNIYYSSRITTQQ